MYPDVDEKWEFSSQASLTQRMKGLLGPSERSNPRSFVSVWKEYELLEKEIVPSYVIVLRTKGCLRYRSGGCTMCSYSKTSHDGPVSADDIISQFESAMKGFKDEQVIKVYTSGSFFEAAEVPAKAQEKIIKRAVSDAPLVLVESLPSFLTDKKLDEVTSYLEGSGSNIEVAIGLESANATTRDHSINKPLSFETFETAAKRLSDREMRVRTYLLLKPPFLTERDAIEDTKKSVAIASKFSDVISINPVNVQSSTLVEQLWHQRLYRPPWLWSLVDVLQNSDASSSTRLLSKPSGGGRSRGVHNCGECDDGILQAIEQFSLGAGDSLLRGATCQCREQWLDLLEFDVGTVPPY